MTARTAIDRYDGPKVKGIDVSDHNGVIAWERVASDRELRFAFIRTGDLRAQGGRNPVDARFAQNWQGAGAVGLHRGAYQFFRGGFSGGEQAEMLIAQVHAAGGMRPGDLPPVIDIEQGGQVYADDTAVPVEVVLRETRVWLERVRSAFGRDPIIYTGQYWHWFVSQRGLSAGFERYPLWVPSYGHRYPKMPVGPNEEPGPWARWTFHQYTANGAVPGIGTDVDLNYFRGDDAALVRFAGGVPNAPTDPSGGARGDDSPGGKPGAGPCPPPCTPAASSVSNEAARFAALAILGLGLLAGVSR